MKYWQKKEIDNLIYIMFNHIKNGDEKMNKVSCVISAYNEEPRLNNVLKAVSNHPLIDEIIVVDDGSSDNTIGEALKFKGIKIIKHKKNVGKARSMLDGAYEAKNNLILFLDADLVNITYENLSQLLKPVIDGSVDMAIGMVKHNSKWNSLLKLLVHGAYSGQRTMKKEIALNTLNNVRGYAAEGIINRYVLENGLKFVIINWQNVEAIARYKERGFFDGIRSYFITSKEVFRVITPFKFIKQCILMRILSKKYKKLL